MINTIQQANCAGFEFAANRASQSNATWSKFSIKIAIKISAEAFATWTFHSDVVRETTFGLFGLFVATQCMRPGLKGLIIFVTEIDTQKLD